ncbi:MAG: metallophosphoesterase [Phycisphaerales bacterium]
MRRSSAITPPGLTGITILAGLLIAASTLSASGLTDPPHSPTIIAGASTHSDISAPIDDESTQNSTQPSEQKRRGKQGKSNQPGATPKDQPGLLSQMTSFKTDVPAHDLDVILVRPTDRSIEVTLAAASVCSAVVEYRRDGTTDSKRSAPAALKPGEVGRIALGGLTPGAEYRYRVGIERRDDKAAGVVWNDESRFRTRPAPGTSFSFAIQADSHLDQSVEPKLYEQTLRNMLTPADHGGPPDFVIDLGDTFMTDKRGRNFQSALPQYDAQRYYFGLVAHSAPLFMVLGNHDGEKGTSGRNADDIGPWSYLQRTRRFPEPIIDGRMYTGLTSIKDAVGANYYAFEWGDALFIILDPFWGTTDRIRGDAGGGDRGQSRPNDETLKPTDASWAMTLGRPQYDWLARTLETTKARHRFVFIHHLVGGLGGNEARGGVEASPFFEWGGNNADGSPGFAQHRNAWPMPIHDLLARHHVSAVFHGHDHLYVHSQRDNVQYQCVPQPGNPPSGTRSAAQYGYETGKLMTSPGYLRVRVTPQFASVEFIRTALDDSPARHARDNNPREQNNTVVDSYSSQ